MYVVYVVYIYIFKGMLKKACDNMILVYITDNTIIDVGNVWAKNVTVFQNKYGLVFNFDFKKVIHG